MPKRGRSDFKFPFDGVGFHVTVRPTHGIDPDFEQVLLGLCESKFEYVLANFEKEGDSRHFHVLVNYKSTSGNLRRIFINCCKEHEIEHGPNGIHVKKVSSTIYNVVQYIGE